MRVKLGIKVMILMAVVAIVSSPLKAAAVVGQCALCHVMHASQANVANPNPAQINLLKYANGCLGCHAIGENGATTGVEAVTKAPQVYKAGGLTYRLAGGDFNYSATAGGDRKGHNPYVNGVLAKDATYGTPPGWVSGFAANTQVGVINGTAGKELTCSGVYGCHGRHDGQSEPMHHADETGIATTVNGGTLGSSYRFLKGIAGGEDDDYQVETVVDRNVYIGANRTTGAADTDAGGTNTISYFCAECHGIFHSGAGTAGLASDTLGSPWLRHPVDFSMPVTGEYGKYGGGIGSGAATGAVNLPAIPLATSVTSRATNVFTAVAENERIVMCLTCHYAHAGPYDSGLRWDYSTTVIQSPGASNTEGCFACHTEKDGVP